VTDSAAHYKFPPVASHEFVDHSKFEWVRDDVHTNTLEGFFSVLKRGLVGVYQHVDSKHLDRYLAEFDSARTTASNSALTTNNARISRSRASPESGSRIKQLIGKRRPKAPYQLELPLVGGGRRRP